MPIRVAHITLSMGTGGIENLILDLCRYTDRSRFELTVVCLDEAGNLFQELKPMGVSGYVERRGPGFDWRLITRLVSFFRQMKFDVVHSHNQASAFYAGIAAFFARVPVSVVTEHSRNYINTRMIRRVEKKIVSSLLDKWITVSHELASSSKEMDKVSGGKIEVILNGVDCHRFSNPEKSAVEAFRDRYRISTLDKHIVMVARLEKIKNHDLMIDALQLLVNDAEKVKLLLLGDGACRPDLEKKVNELGLVDQVVFLGVSRSVAEILALSDVFVLCSHSEGLPLSLLEASAAQVPVVITENSNCANFIKNMEKGIVVKDEASSLAAGIKECLLNPEQTARMSAAARRDVVENFSLECTVRRYEDIYLKLLATKRGHCA